MNPRISIVTDVAESRIYQKVPESWKKYYRIRIHTDSLYGLEVLRLIQNPEYYFSKIAQEKKKMKKCKSSQKSEIRHNWPTGRTKNPRELEYSFALSTEGEVVPNSRIFR